MSSLRTYSFRTGCSLSEPKGLGAADTISAPVGAGGRNIAEDVRTVQRLLNTIPPAKGGPGKPLAVDGMIGPLTLAAIRQFQGKHLGWADGRVDPEGPTLTKLRALTPIGALAGQASGGTAAGQSFPDTPMHRAIRLATATAVQEDARRALHAARLALDAWELFIRKKTPRTGFDPHKKTSALFNRHFGEPVGREEESVGFARRKIVDMISLIDDPRPSIFGGTFGNFLDIDTIPHPVNDKGQPVFGYVRIQGKQNAALDKAGVDPTKIYVTAAMDGKSRDAYLLLVLHEVGHLSSNRGPAVMLADHAYGWDPKYFTLSHQSRLSNADSYANFAFELAHGNARLAAVVPEQKVRELEI